MGRLSKSKVDQIIEMVKDDYTVKEIAKKVGCSESTVTRVKKRLTTASTVDEEAKFRVVIVEMLYRMLEIMELSFNLKEESVELLVRPQAIQFTKQLMKHDPRLTKKALKESGFYEYHVKPILIEKKDEINRREWIEFLKKYYPEKLADLI